MKYQVMRDLTREEYGALKESIIESGVLVPVVLDEHGNIIDGHHRKMICEEIGAKYPVQVVPGLTEAEKLNMARQLNEARRQLTPEEKRREIERRLRDAPETSDRQIAKAVGASNTHVSNIRNEMVQSKELSTVDSSIGADGKVRPRRPIAIYNPTPAEQKAMQNPAVLEKLIDGTAGSVADARRETKREEIVARLESIEAQEAKVVQGVYDVIVIDPPWPMQKIERDERPNQSEFDYPTMTEDELSALEIPAADDCHMWLWTTHKFLPMAFRLLDRWGFKYVCTFVWHKPGGFQPIGLPQYNCEFALYARKGAPSFIDTKAFNTCFDAPRGAHSEKPEAFYDVVRRVTAGRRIDMFNRRPIAGFDVWGQEA